MDTVILLIIYYIQTSWGLLFLENDYWRCTAIDKPLSEWNIPKTSSIITKRQKITHLEQFKSQDLILYAFMAQGKCYFKVVDERSGYPELTFAATKQSKKVIIRTLNWFDMGLNPHGKCDWGIDIEQVRCTEKRPIRCLVNCIPLISKWDQTKCVFMDILSPTVVKPGSMNISVQIVHMAAGVEKVPVVIYSPHGQKITRQIHCGMHGQTAQSSTHHESMYCKWENRRNIVGYGCHGDVEVKVETSGTWTVRGPYEVVYQLKITVAHAPTLSNIGPYVIKKDVAKVMMIEPKYSVKIVTMPMHISTSKINPNCQSYVIPMLNGWNRWLRIMEPEIITKRPKRDLIAKLIGGAGAGIGAVNAIGQIRIAQQLAALANNFVDLTHPIQDALLAVDKLQLDVTKLLPLWVAIQEADNLQLLQIMENIQSNVSLALACIQAQAILIDIAKDILRDSTSGKVPVEISKLLQPYLNEFERSNPEWWSVIHTKYDLKEEQLQMSILMMREALKEYIYPIVPIGMFVNHSLLLPLPDRMWAHIKEDDSTVRTVNLQACVEQVGLGYTCTTGLWEYDHICFNPDFGKCHYDLHPSNNDNNHSVVVQRADGCICIRSLCPHFTVNTYYKVVNPGTSNLCLCKVFHIQGCDIKVILSKPSEEQYTVSLQMISIIEPVSIGPNLNAMKSLFHHPELIGLVKEINDLGNRTGIIIHHAVDKISEVRKHVKTTTSVNVNANNWWDVFSSFSEMSPLFSYPMIVSFVLHFCILVYVIVLTIVVCKMANHKVRNTFVLERGTA
ncbi:uncharacterized protein LOC142827230 [Pelodiscus sinensis]|uniref:uncharacterized protein LOC142827230 n=1 Tax=Pelodiscus sinensis TaxID=13735 RepID=UPI003F6B8217